MASLTPTPKLQFFDSNGDPLSGGKLYTYAAGTTTPLATYTDYTGGTPNANPVVLDSRGEASVWTGNSSYKFVLKTSADVTVYTVDRISGVMSQSQLQSLIGPYQWLSSVAGTNTITASSAITITAYTAGQHFNFIPANTNTGAVTVNIDGVGAINLYKRSSTGLVALVANDLPANCVASVVYDGTQLELLNVRPYSHGADIASASTINLDTATGDCVDVTGTTTITAITLAEGVERTVRFTGALTLTHGGSLVLPGAANITTAAGDYAVFRGYASSVVRCVVYSKASGYPIVSLVPQIQPISASVSGNALTISASALSLDFRSSTLGSGTVTTVTGTPSNLVISSGSTLGTVSGNQSRIIVLAINNAGTIELAAVNVSGGVDLTETGLISTTAEGGAGAADSASVIYSTTARSNVAYRVLGYIESTQATAGTWATSPSTIQGAGGVSLTSLTSFGMGQTWQTVVRSLATTYYNTTGRPIFVYLNANSASSNYNILTINGIEAGRQFGSTANLGVGGIVPPGGSYSWAATSASVVTASELR